MKTRCVFIKYKRCQSVNEVHNSWLWNDQIKPCKWMPNMKVTSNRKLDSFNYIRKRKRGPEAAGTDGKKINDWNLKLIGDIVGKTANESINYDTSQGRPSVGAKLI